MGLSMMDTRCDQEGSVPGGDARRRRFGEYFPRLFAYVRPWADDDSQARDLVTEVFARAFARPVELSDAEFSMALFGLAREVCHGGRAGKRLGGLNSRERDVIGLLFDARLRRSEVGRLLSMDDRTVTSTLVHGLKKLRASLTSPVATALLHS